jgi:hypothetical protein
MNEAQLLAHDLLMSSEATGHAHNLVSLQEGFKYPGDQTAWVESHVVQSEEIGVREIALAAAASIADEVRETYLKLSSQAINA